MRIFEIVLALIAFSSLLQPVARRLDVPLPILQVLGGLLLSPLATGPDVSIDSRLIFTLFVPPLLFFTASTSSLRDVRANARPILLLAVALVVGTAIAVAVVVHAVAPQLTWAGAFVLGAIVAPTDADVTTAIARKLGVPWRLVTVIEGETLLNDTAAFILYGMAVQAAVSGTFAPRHEVISFVVMSAGGVAVGLTIGWLLTLVRWLSASALAISAFSLVTPFAAYLVAEGFQVSGVLAVVTAGFLLSRFVPRSATAQTRLRAYALWDSVTFVIGGLVFTLIGLRLGRLAPQLLKSGAESLLLWIGVVSVTLVAVRMLWVFGGAYIPGFLDTDDRERVQRPSWRALTVVGWAGLRGGDTLVMALALPTRMANGAPFPARASIVAVSVGVIAVTLLIHGMTLRPLIRALAMPHDDFVDNEEQRARVEAVGAAQRRLDEITAHAELPAEIVTEIKGAWALRAKPDMNEDDGVAKPEGRSTDDRVRLAEREMLDAAHAAVVRLRDGDIIGQEALQRVQTELDLEDVR